MGRIAVYVDLDNIYGGVLDKLGIRLSQAKLSVFQRELLKRVMSYFITLMERKLFLTSDFEILKVENEQDYICISFKTFAVYEKLPHANIVFQPSFQSFLHTLGATPINPFVDSKRKNAADIALILEVIEDVVIKKIPADSVMVCTGDSDLYPLISWLKMHTGKEIIISGFGGRVNRIYSQTPVVNRKVLLDAYLEKAVNKVVKKIIDKGDLRNFKDEDLNFVEKLSILEDNLKSSLINYIKKTRDSEPEDNYKYRKFKEKLLKALKSWLSKNDYASTGVVINSWLPRWKLDIDVAEANQYLKKILSSGELEHEGIKFIEEKKESDFIVGSFYKKSM